MVREIFIDGTSYGKIGSLVPKKHHNLDCDLYVGDIIVYYHENFIRSSVVLNESNANTYGVYGCWYKKFKFDKLIKMLDHTETDDETKIKYIGTMSQVTIEEDTVVEMTIEEIQRLLGHKVKIIKS